VFSGELNSSQPAFLVGKGKAMEGRERELGDIHLVCREKVASTKGELEINLGLKVPESGGLALFILGMPHGIPILPDGMGKFQQLACKLCKPTRCGSEGADGL